MPKLKMKTHKSTAKRLRFTGSGKIVRSSAKRGHFRRNKSLRRLQQLKKSQPLDKTQYKMARTAMPYGSTR